MKVKKTENGFLLQSEHTGKENDAIVAILDLMEKSDVRENIYNNNGMKKINGRFLNYCEVPFSGGNQQIFG